MSSHDDVLVRETLAPHAPERPEIEPDWEDVLGRATWAEDVIGSPTQARRGRWRAEHVKRSLSLRRRILRPRLALVTAVMAALAASALALGAVDAWWFEDVDGTPSPTTEVMVVADGVWGGKDWSLTAYRTRAGDVCYGLTPGSSANATGRGAALSCAHVGRSAQAIATLVGGAQSDFPPYIVGPVVEEARDVRIKLESGRVIETRAVSAPGALQLPIRFYAEELPCGSRPVEVVALADDGAVIGRVSLPEGRSANEPCG